MSLKCVSGGMVVVGAILVELTLSLPKRCDFTH